MSESNVSNIIPFPVRHSGSRSLAPMASPQFTAPPAVIQALAPTVSYIRALLILSGAATLRELKGKTRALPGCTWLESAAILFGGAVTLN